MRKNALDKCQDCNANYPLYKLTVCDNCLKRYCDEHIYIGIDTGDLYLKNLCQNCLEELGIFSNENNNVVSKEDIVNLNIPSLDEEDEDEKVVSNNLVEKENKQINYSLIKKNNSLNFNTTNINKGNGVAFLDEDNSRNNNKNADHKKETSTKKERWEYKTVFLAIDSEIEVEEHILKHIVEDYINVFPVNREDVVRSDIIDIDKLNELGDEGWEVITTIPKTKSVIIIKKNGKPSTSVSANISGAYVILKRRK